MGTSVWRRLGVIFLIVVVLSLGLVSAAAAAPEQAPDNTASASCAPTYYRVRYGDNLTSIAWRYGVTVWQLQQWNGISNPNRIYAGQTLVIYRCYDTAAAAVQSVPAGMLAMRLSGATATTATTATAASAATVRVWCLSVSAATASTATPRWMLERSSISTIRTLTTPSMTRCDANINFNWTGTSPAPGTINQFNFSSPLDACLLSECRHLSRDCYLG